MTILKILNDIASNSSKKYKEQVLQDNASNETLQRVFYLAYQPTINFFIKKIPAYTPNNGATSIFDDTQKTLFAALADIESVLAGRKLTGGAAANYLKNTLEELSAEDAEVLTRVVLRDLRVDASANTANKVWKNLILDVPYMRCSLPKEVDLKAFPWVTGVYSQLKSDGAFVNVNVYADGVEFMTRNGNLYPDAEQNGLGDIIDEIRLKMKFDLQNQLHGELLIYKDGVLMPRDEGNGVLNKLLKGSTLPAGHKVVFVPWDIIPLEEAKPKNKYKVPYKERLSKLESFGFDGPVQVVETRVVHSIREAYEHYQEMLALGLEGTILKDPDAIWEDTTSKGQVKFKLSVQVELECVGFNPGKGKNASTFGSAVMRSSDGLLVVNCSGFKDKDRQFISDNREDFINTIWTVESNAMTKVRADGTRSLFLPRYIEVRRDKTEADSLQRIVDQFENAVKNLEMLLAA